MLENSITLLWLVFWLIFTMFQKRVIFIIAFTATLLYIFYNLNIAVTDTGLLWYYLLLYAILLLDVNLERQK